MERILLRHTDSKPLSSRLDFTFSTSSLLSPDRVSKMILENHKLSFDGKMPAFVSGDGNCLFNSLSVGQSQNSIKTTYKLSLITKTIIRRNCTF